MKSLLRLLFRHISISFFAAIVFSLGLFIVLKTFSGYAVRQNNVKAILARSIISCLHQSIQSEAKLNCQAVLKGLQETIPEFKYDVWVVNRQSEIVFQNGKTLPPATPTKFDDHPGEYVLLEKRKILDLSFRVPKGYVDDAKTQLRVLIGSSLPGNTVVHTRNATLAILLSLFLFGVLFSAFLSFIILTKRAREAQRIYQSLSQGDLSARFKAQGFDELSELSSSFNKMVDLLAKSLTDLKESEEQRKSLVSELSHDLRTPLTSMTSFIQLLQGGKNFSALEKECVESISAEIKYLNQLVTNLFELSQIERPQSKFERTLFSITETLYEIESDFTLQCQNKPVRFRADLSKEMPMVLGDAIFARRMICNLVENSLRFAKSEVLMTSTVDHKENMIIIDILDDGPGFPDHLLKTFGHVSNKRNLSSSGPMHMGLGSVIAMKIIQLHEGQMSTSNRESGGAKVTLKLPITPKKEIL